MFLKKPKDVKLLFKIAARYSGRFDCKHVMFFEGNAAATDGKVLVILFDCYEGIDISKFYVKASPADVLIKEGRIRELQCEQNLTWPDLKKLIPAIVPGETRTSMGQAMNLVEDHFDRFVWATNGADRMALMLHDRDDMVVIGHQLSFKHAQETLNELIHQTNKTLEKCNEVL